MGRVIFNGSQMSNVKLGTTQVQKMYLGTSLVWNLGAFSAASVDSQGSGPFGVSGTFTFNVISSTGNGAGGQITGTVSNFRRLTSVDSIVDGGSGHEIGDILTVEMVGANWSIDPKIEVTAL